MFASLLALAFFSSFSLVFFLGKICQIAHFKKKFRRIAPKWSYLEPNCAIEPNLPFWRYSNLPNLSSFSLVNITQNNFDIFKGKAQNDKSVIVLLPLFLCLFFWGNTFVRIYIWFQMTCVDFLVGGEDSSIFSIIF